MKRVKSNKKPMPKPMAANNEPKPDQKDGIQLTKELCQSFKGFNIEALITEGATAETRAPARAKLFHLPLIVHTEKNSLVAECAGACAMCPEPEPPNGDPLSEISIKEARRYATRKSITELSFAMDHVAVGPGGPFDNLFNVYWDSAQFPSVKAEVQNGDLTVRTILNSICPYNSNTAQTMSDFNTIEEIFAKELPQMPIELIKLRIYDPHHRVMLLVKRNQPIGGICFVSHLLQDFVEIVFMAMKYSHQRKGYGTFLLCCVKDLLLMRGNKHLLTYAKYDSKEFLLKNNFTERIPMPRSHYQEIVKVDKESVLMYFHLNPEILQTNSDRARDPDCVVQWRSPTEIIYKCLDGTYLTLSTNFKPLAEGEFEDPFELEGILKLVRKHHNAWPFRSSIRNGRVPDYYFKLKKPMDLKMMDDNLRSGEYMTPKPFNDDMKLIFSNCREFNKPDTNIYRCADILEQYFNSINPYDEKKYKKKQKKNIAKDNKENMDKNCTHKKKKNIAQDNNENKENMDKNCTHKKKKNKSYADFEAMGATGAMENMDKNCTHKKKKKNITPDNNNNNENMENMDKDANKKKKNITPDNNNNNENEENMNKDANKKKKNKSYADFEAMGATGAMENMDKNCTHKKKKKNITPDNNNNNENKENMDKDANKKKKNITPDNNNNNENEENMNKDANKKKKNKDKNCTHKNCIHKKMKKNITPDNNNNNDSMENMNKDANKKKKNITPDNNNNNENKENMIKDANKKKKNKSYADFEAMGAMENMDKNCTHKKKNITPDNNNNNENKENMIKDATKKKNMKQFFDIEAMFK